jgi:hypothetical protein
MACWKTLALTFEKDLQIGGNIGNKEGTEASKEVNITDNKIKFIENE